MQYFPRQTAKATEELKLRLSSKLTWERERAEEATLLRWT